MDATPRLLYRLMDLGFSLCSELLMANVLGIDLGTQSLKVLVYDSQRREISAATSAPLEVDRDSRGKAEQSASAWLDALRKALTEIPAALRESLEAVSVSGQQHGFVAVDERGEVLAPVKLWCDTSTTAECATITERLGGVDAAIRDLGNPILPGYTASKILWLKNAHPDLYERMTGILLPHDFLNFYLTGLRTMEAGDASGTGFLDVQSRAWSKKALRAMDPARDLAACLPEVRCEPGVIGELSHQAARELGLPPSIPVASGGGDNMMAAIGTANVRPGRVTMSLGTSGTVFACSDRPIVDPKGEVAAFCSSTGSWLPLLCTMNCTVASETMRGLFGFDLEAFEQKLASASIGADGVLVVPYFQGERSPDLPTGKGSVLYLDPDNTTPANLLRASVEGATFSLRRGLERLAELGTSADEIVLTGGGAHSASWRQIVADISARPVVVTDRDEGAAWGAALQALSVLEGTPAESLEDLVREHVGFDAKQACEPVAENVDRYEDAYQRYLRAADQMALLYS